MTLAEVFSTDHHAAHKHLLDKGVKINNYINTYSHLSILSFGSIRVKNTEGSKVYDAGDCIVIKANTEHDITALEDACWFCIYTGV